MKEITENNIVAFAVEFVKKVADIDDSLIYDSYIFRWSNKKITLYEIYENELTVDEVLKYCEITNEDISVFTDISDCLASLCIEGDLYEMMYYYEAYGDGGKKAKSLLKAARIASENNGLQFEWADGALYLYDLQKLTEQLMNLIK